MSEEDCLTADVPDFYYDRYPRGNKLMSSVTGVVDGVFEKNGLFTLKVGGVMYGCYKTAPKVSKGDNISFDWKESNGFKNAVVNSIVVNGASSKTTATTSDNVTPFRDTRQESIEWQSARNAAVQLVSAMLASDVVKLPSKHADKYDATMALVSDLTERFVSESKALKIQEKQMAPTQSKYAEEE